MTDVRLMTLKRSVFCLLLSKPYIEMKPSILFILLIIIINSCSNNSPIELSPIRTDDLKHLGKGVYAKIPSNYKRALSFDGYQEESMLSSVSVQVEKAPLWKIRRNFDTDVLKFKKSKLLELRPVKYGTIDSCFFSKVQDFRKNTIRYLLAINDGDKTYLVKAFCPKQLDDKYDDKLREVLFSSYVSRVYQEFKFAKATKTGEQLYTKDGQYPTESKDKSEMSVGRVNDFQFGKNIYTYLKEKIFLHTGQHVVKFQKKFTPLTLANGSYTEIMGQTGDKKVYAGFLKTGKEKQPLLIMVVGNDQLSLEETKQDVWRKFVPAQKYVPHY